MSGKDGDMEICVFQIDHDKLDLRPDLRHNLFKCKHPGLADRYPERAERDGHHALWCTPLFPRGGCPHKPWAMHIKAF